MMAVIQNCNYMPCHTISRGWWSIMVSS